MTVNHFRNIKYSSPSSLPSVLNYYWIAGKIKNRRDPNFPLTSTVFSKDALFQAANSNNVFTHVHGSNGGYDYIDNAKIVRELLKKALNSLVCEKSKAAIKRSVVWLRSHLESGGTHFWIAKSLLPCSAVEQAAI